MKLYLAAPWIDKDKMEALAWKFEDAGHTITWRWWRTDDIAEGWENTQSLAVQAFNDFHGVKDCDTLVLFNTSKSEGKAVEQGIAIALEKPILAIGKLGEMSKNVFHYLPNYKWVPFIEDAIKALEDYIPCQQI
jgi:nucleoside 2-deoxyribosyltransferase